jgi:hypothetical protein
LEGQLYEKILEHIGKARKELPATAAEQNCSVTIYACVINWFEQFIYLSQDRYQQIVNWLERDKDQESLIGIDGVLFVTKMGWTVLFLNREWGHACAIGYSRAVGANPSEVPGILWLLKRGPPSSCPFWDLGILVRD